MKTKFFALILLCACINLYAQKIEKVEPPNWWEGMKLNQIELLVYGDKISELEPSIESEDIDLKNVVRTGNKNYLFLNVNFSKAKKGKFIIKFSKKGKVKLSYEYEIKERKHNSENRVGFDSSDAIYLITPDRFANGDTSNDIRKYFLEKHIDRKHDYARHGGDIQGITNSLDYIDDLGFTAIWSTPLLTNNMKEGSYHGYAITDLYQTDPRFGTLKEYIQLSKECKKRGMKLIMDQVANHIGLEHWWMKDLPTNDWINYQKGYENSQPTIHSNHRRTTNQDIYASKMDREGNSDGWFVSAMPDLNQRNPLLAKYLIQNSIWWIETLDLGGIRQDTYPYPDKDFMSKWAGTIMKEYANFSIVGEEWSYNPLLVGYWQRGAYNRDGYKSNLKSSMDFPMQKAIVDGLNEKETWGTGLVKIYEGLANDFAYPTPKDIMIFPDNHDMDRIFTQVKEDVEKAKMALGLILTLPRIPQLYYGTEILMQNTAKPGDHGLIRTDFPGGWKDDKINGFTGKNLNSNQKETQSFLKKVLNFRKNSEAIHDGKTIHFAPIDGVYVLFRFLENETVCTIINKNESEIKLNLSRFEEVGLKGQRVKNIISDEEFIWNNELIISKRGATILSIKK